MVKCDTHAPHVAPLVVVLIFYDFRREGLRGPDQLIGLDVTLVVENARLTHVAELDCLPSIFQHQIHALDISMYDVVAVQVQDTETHLPGVGPYVLLREVPSTLFLLLNHL